MDNIKKAYSQVRQESSDVKREVLSDQQSSTEGERMESTSPHEFDAARERAARERVRHYLKNGRLQ